MSDKMGPPPSDRRYTQLKRADMVRLIGAGMAALTVSVSCGSGTSAHAGHSPWLSMAQKDSTMLEILDQLAAAPAGSLDTSDVASSFGVELTQADQNGNGEKYFNKTPADGFHLEVFVLPDQEFRLMITRLDNEAIADWRAQLAEKGWRAEAPILHPFTMDSFRKDGKQIRLEHNSASVSSITVFGLNASRGE